ncbi:MAG: hypothetical protein VX768_01835 [Planctomycetota bacterium]|nr:hypothetical protein [Planctomycetota bacterium]
MSLERMQLQLDESALPEAARRIITSGRQAIEAFQAVSHTDPVPGFHPGDFEEAWRWLVAVSGQLDHRSSPRCCEWGSGFAVVSALASLVGFQCTAIESDRRLFKASARWLHGLGAELEHLQGSFIPADFSSSWKESQAAAEMGSMSLWLDLEARFALEGKEEANAIFDLVYAYPWPGEETFVFELFDFSARRGAWLLTFHGAADFRLHRKTD